MLREKGGSGFLGAISPTRWCRTWNCSTPSTTSSGLTTGTGVCPITKPKSGLPIRTRLRLLVLIGLLNALRWVYRGIRRSSPTDTAQDSRLSRWRIESDPSESYCSDTIASMPAITTADPGRSDLPPDIFLASILLRCSTGHQFGSLEEFMSNWWIYTDQWHVKH